VTLAACLRRSAITTSACSYLGINTSRYRIIVLVLTAIVAALAGFGYAAFGGVAAPENASFYVRNQVDRHGRARRPRDIIGASSER